MGGGSLMDTLGGGSMGGGMGGGLGGMIGQGQFSNSYGQHGW